MAKSRTVKLKHTAPLRTHARAKRKTGFDLGMVIGMVVLMIAIIGGGIGVFLAQQTTESRSQASVFSNGGAQISVAQPFVRQDGYVIQQVGVDTSALKAGTTVTNFRIVLAIPRPGIPVSDPIVVRAEGQPETDFVVMPLPVVNCRSNKDCPQGLLCYTPPHPHCENGQPCPEINPLPQCVPPYQLTPIPTEKPTAELLGHSQDWAIRVRGANAFKEVRDLRVNVDTTPERYVISISGKADRNNKTLQTAFAKNEPFVTVVLHDVIGSALRVNVKAASVKGFIPGIPKERELIGPVVIPSLVVTNPPDNSCISDRECAAGQYCELPTSTCKVGEACPEIMVRGECKASEACRSNKDCKAGYGCMEQPAPTCKPGMMCKQTIPFKKCVPLPKWSSANEGR